MISMKKVCDNCKYGRSISWVDVIDKVKRYDFVCGNCESDYVSESMNSDDWCSEWKGCKDE